MEAEFRAGDETLAQLVAARREEVVKLQKDQADRLKDIETRGQARLADLKKRLPREIVSTLDTLEATHEQAAEATRSHVEIVKSTLVQSRPSQENETAVHPGLAGGQLVVPGSVG
jgi:hypothetical protein